MGALCFLDSSRLSCLRRVWLLVLLGVGLYVIGAALCRLRSRSEQQYVPLDATICEGNCSVCSCGIVYVLCLHTPVIPLYQKLYQKSGGRKPHQVTVERSVRSFRAFNAGVKVSLVTDDHALPTSLLALFDFVQYLDTSQQKKPWQEKTASLLMSPFDRTLYVDADTIFCGSVMPIFNLYLVLFDVAVVRHQPSMEQLLKLYRGQATIEQLNLNWLMHYSALVAFRRGERGNKFLRAWRECDETTAMADQECLNHVIATQRIGASVFVLPAEYLIVERANELPVLLQGEVRVVHGVQASCKANWKKGPRLFNSGHGTMIHWEMFEGGQLAPVLQTEKAFRQAVTNMTLVN